MGWMSIAHQALFRLILSIGLLVTLLGIGSFWLYSVAVEKSTQERANDLAHFYRVRLAQQDRDWELQAQDIKVRIEVNRLLENPRLSFVQLQAFMTVQGNHRRFQTLLIQDPQGRNVFSFGNPLPLDTIHTGAMGKDSGSTWHMANGDLYRLFVLPIWFGERGTGHLAVFFKVDNALLFNMAAPDITLWIEHHDRIKASSAGQASIDQLNESMTVHRGRASSERAIPWSVDDPQTLLHIDSPIKTLFSRTELAVTAAVIPLLDGLILWFTLGFWLMRNSRRVTALGGAVTAFATDHHATPGFAQALSSAQGTQEDEITVVAAALNEMAVQSEQRERERAIEEAQRHLWSQVFASSLDAIVITDSHNAILSVNAAFTRLTGYEETDVVGKNPRILSSGRESPEFYAAMWRDITQKGQWSGEVEDRRKDGSVYPKWLNISVVRAPDGAILNHVGVFKDITAQKQSEERFIYLANHDTLTTLPNRHLLTDRLRKAIELATRSEGRLALLFLDLDNFKWVNDSLGHANGDKLLITVATRLLAAVRASDTVARLGGDEFVVLIIHPSGNQEVASIAEKVIAAVAQPLDLGGHEYQVTISIGISVFPNDGQDSTALIKHADTALYAAKGQGKNQFRFFDSELNRHAVERTELERGLRQAIKQQEFELHYQPKLCIKSDSICGAEALIRWRHPELGLIPPDKFIPLAEETGLIVEIGEWVIRETCRQISVWEKRGIKLRGVAVNLSALQIEALNFVDTVTRIMDESGVSPEQLELELTESAVLRSPDRSIATLQRLRQMGFRLALDDFGTGYSSLSYLKRLPVDIVKIDRSFVNGIPDDEGDMQIVRMTIALAKSIHLVVVAEGIETAQQHEFFKEIGCEFLQGYLISRPLPARDFEKLLTRTDHCGLPVRCEFPL